MLFLGLDLAWGSKNTSGGVAISYELDSQRGIVLDVQDALGDDDSIVAWVHFWDNAAGEAGLLIGVDAPLWVPNIAGKRSCETEIGRRFARFQAGAHPANRGIFQDDVRGERLAERLAKIGIEQNPLLALPWQYGVRQVMEVFPHPAHIVLFGLPRTLKYKAKKGRDYPSRWAAFQEYARHLRLLALELPLVLPDDWPPSDFAGLRGGCLKRLEDSLDALTCAFIVLWYWQRGSAGAEVFGNLNDGHIVVPRKVALEVGVQYTHGFAAHSHSEDTSLNIASFDDRG